MFKRPNIAWLLPGSLLVLARSGIGLPTTCLPEPVP
jgi:hypothetical protein